MAWVKDGISKTISVSDYGEGGYSHLYAKASVTCTVTGDKVKCVITMTVKNNGTECTSATYGHLDRPKIALYFSVDGKKQFEDYYSNWDGFPNQSRSTWTKTITTKNKNDASIPFTIKLSTSQDTTGGTYQSVASAKLTRTWYTPIGTGDVKIKDNGDNTFTITGTKGKNGDNNTASGPNLSWGYTDSYGTTATSGRAISLTIENPKAATRRVYAENVTTAAHGSSTTAKTHADIKQHVAPNAPTNLEITHSKSRMTIKENWTLSWTAATAKNKSSPITGYRIRLFKNGKAIPLKNSNGKIVSTAGTDDNYYDRPLTTTKETTMLIDMQHYDFKPGDKVKATLYAYHTNGAGTKLFSSRVTSDTYTVRNSGIMRAKLSGAWKEGQVYVKISDDWKEAAAVYVKINGSWKESV